MQWVMQLRVLISQHHNSPILEGEGAFAKAGRAGVLLGNAHGVAVELLGKKSAKGHAILDAEQARPEVPDDGGAVSLFLGLYVKHLVIGK